MQTILWALVRFPLFSKVPDLFGGSDHFSQVESSQSGLTLPTRPVRFDRLVMS